MTAALMSTGVDQAETIMAQGNEKLADAARMRAWLEEIGGAVLIGDGKLKDVKISKKGTKLTLVIKRTAKTAKPAAQPTA